jgi:hypothetical protein
MTFGAEWRRHRRESNDASLDDLLLAAQPRVRVGSDAGPHPLRWVVRAALVAFAAAAVIAVLFRVFALAPPFSLVLAVCVGAVLVRRAVSVTGEPYPYRTRDLVRSRGPSTRINPSEWYEGADGMIESVRRWERRLEWGITTREWFDATVAAKLGELVDERLRQRHGLTRASDPVRARALLGEEVWDLLHGGIRRAPRVADVARAISIVERI